MHKDIKKLNKKDPPPKGCNHKAYEVYPSNGHSGGFYIGYLNDGNWNMPVIIFKTEIEAYRYILDELYYGD